MVLSVIETFCKYIRASIVPHTLEKSERSQIGSLTTSECEDIAIYLPEMLRSVRSTYATLIKLDLPNEALDIVSHLLVDLRIHCMSVVFQQTTEQVKQLSETWCINFSGKHTGVTELPLKFLQLIEDVILIVKESALSTEQREGFLLENVTAKKELETQLQNILKAFHEVLYNLSLGEDYDDCDEGALVVSQLIGTPVSNHKLNSSNESNVPSWEHRLLITLTNCVFTKNTVLDTIQEKFTSTGFSSVEVPITNSKIMLDNLEKSILEKYLEQKSDPLVGTIEPSMYLGRFDWDLSIKPTDIRPYAKECINNLISVLSEVNAISITLLENVLPKIVETIAEELYRLMSCVKKFSKEGAQQARVDIGALTEFFECYLSENAQMHFKEALNVIPTLERADMVLVEDIIKQCKGRMKTQLLCLRKNSPR